MLETENLKLFEYQVLNGTITTYINIPYEGSIEELAHVLILNEKLPKYMAKDLIKSLSQFIEKHTIILEDEHITKLLLNGKESTDFEDVTKEWEKLIKEEMAEYGEQRCASDEELFATAYHKMVHSRALETMLQLEHMYAKIVRKRCEEKNRQINDMSEKQTLEMNKALEHLEEDMAEMKINQLVSQQFEDQSFLQIQLTSELDTIKEAQRREYREWLMQMLEENQANSSLPTPNSPLSPPPIPIPAMMPYTDNSINPILEESFTIHLGSQLKQMHNIRILSSNVMDLCAIIDSECSEPMPQTLQTALNLYSNDLHGLVLMADNIIGSRAIKEFKDICQSSTEFHFNNIEDQLDKIISLQNEFKRSKGTADQRKSTKHLQPGDFYMTKHSNLSQSHVIFHIIVDDSVKCNDINSRHPVVLGLRNILKVACSNDVTSLTIPLLLNYEMTEEMTISWCEKRAELVFKCIKGFMIEMASWGGSDLKNLQFMLPQGISSEVFQSLTEMLPRIFKVSNPLILT
ncbi:PREDICTED: protein C12orf4 [Nicrophorus vespilloides]|uniref:Protein C12orf4 n=1 Tax=Nicrophorus vespilloides TaxID=110193 RepID=A0ABM1MKA2_NICVS|nr:PREDICTED: protein C12orf4 [Nicrophorus vespilloides]